MNEGDLLLGTVEKVTNTITIVRLENGEEGTIVSSEIAPGRIKHLRQYVVPNKKIVCKVLALNGCHIHLSLRRVNSKERKEVLEKYKQTQATKVAFNQILGNDSKEESKILKDFESLVNFINSAKEDESLIEKYIPKKSQEAIKKVVEKRRKKQELRHKIQIKCLEDDGVKKIKEIFKTNDSDINITYISAGNFNLKLTVDDFKQGKKKMAELVQELEAKSKKCNCEFTATEEK
jgi:translation initiation factor 2 alpha subunit (eIF-2alpha)